MKRIPEIHVKSCKECPRSYEDRGQHFWNYRCLLLKRDIIDNSIIQAEQIDPRCPLEDVPESETVETTPSIELKTEPTDNDGESGTFFY